MPKVFKLALREAQRQELIHTRDHASRPYLRVRATAILKVADGQSASAVARSGLLKPIGYEAVSEWVKRYQAHGVAGLTIRSGRGRKPAFSPSARDDRGGP